MAKGEKKEVKIVQRRVAVRKVYVLRIALLGLYVGLLIGFVMAEIIYALMSMAVKFVTPYQKDLLDFGYNISSFTTPDFIFNVSAGFLAFCVVFFPLVFAGLAVLYNLLAKLGGAVHFGLSDYIVKK
jgi:hypothetical protein